MTLFYATDLHHEKPPIAVFGLGHATENNYLHDGGEVEDTQDLSKLAEPIGNIAVTGSESDETV